jgi:hypothetical protein
MSLVFLEAFVEPNSLSHARFAGGALALCRLGVLLFRTSIHGSCHASSRQSTAGVDSVSGMLTAVNIGLFWLAFWLGWPARLGLGVRRSITDLCIRILA